MFDQKLEQKFLHFHGFQIRYLEKTRVIISEKRNSSNNLAYCCRFNLIQQKQEEKNHSFAVCESLIPNGYIFVKNSLQMLYYVLQGLFIWEQFYFLKLVQWNLLWSMFH